MHLETMYLEVDGAVATLVLNRPQVLNCANEQWARDLNTLVDDLLRHAGLRVVVVRGAGRAFCSGIDITALSQGEIGHDLLPQLGDGAAQDRDARRGRHCRDPVALHRRRPAGRARLRPPRRARRCAIRNHRGAAKASFPASACGASRATPDSAAPSGWRSPPTSSTRGRRSTGVWSTGSVGDDAFEPTHCRAHGPRAVHGADVHASDQEADQHGVRDVVRRLRRDLLRVSAPVHRRRPSTCRRWPSIARRAPHADSSDAHDEARDHGRLTLEPIERASRDELAGPAARAAHVVGPARLRPRGAVPGEMRRPRAPIPTTSARSTTSRDFRSRPSRISATAIRSACSPCRAIRSCACTPRAAPPASRRSSATRRATSTPGPS